MTVFQVRLSDKRAVEFSSIDICCLWGFARFVCFLLLLFVHVFSVCERGHLAAFAFDFNAHRVELNVGINLE